MKPGHLKDISCFHNATTEGQVCFYRRSQKTPKCSLFRLEHPGTKIASYVILNENQSPLSGPEVETDLSACILGGEKKTCRAKSTSDREKTKSNADIHTKTTTAAASGATTKLFQVSCMSSGLSRFDFGGDFLGRCL